MFAIVNVSGKQFKIKENCYFIVDSIQGNIGDKVILSKVIMYCENGKIITGNELKNFSIECKVIENKRDKVTVFKSNPRQKRRTKNGHFKYFCTLMVSKIVKKLEA